MESAIIDRLESFLLELGKGFLFEARQRRFTFDNEHFFVDLVFYNRLLRCYVLVDLKRDKLTHQDLGQMQMYVNYFDRYVKLDDELPTVGIVLCRRKNDALMELTLPKDANIFAPNTSSTCRRNRNSRWNWNVLRKNWKRGVVHEDNAEHRTRSCQGTGRTVRS